MKYQFPCIFIDVQTNSITTEFGYIVNAHTLLYCPLKDNINDKSGNHTMTLNTTGYGSVAKDGTGFYHFTGGYISSENYTGPTQGTISVWVKRENKTTGDTSLQWGLTNTYKNGNPYYSMAFEFNGHWDTNVGNYTSYFRNIGGATLNQWELRTMTYSPSEGGKMYKNGLQVDSFSSNQNLWQYNGPSLIGGSYYQGSYGLNEQYFKGYLSDVIMEDRARTQSEIQDYFNKMIKKYGEAREDFQEVEYIQSSGTQYIDTGYIVSNKTIVETKWSFVSYMPTEYDRIYGCIDSSYQFAIQTNNTYNQKIRALNYTSTSAYYVDSSYNISLNTIYETKHNNTQFLINGVSQGTCNSSTYTITNPLTIFCLNDGTSSKTAYSRSKIYYFKIYDENNLLRDLVPCYRKSDGVIGMFDKVYNQFYTNSGTGSFTKGPDVN